MASPNIKEEKYLAQVTISFYTDGTDKDEAYGNAFNFVHDELLTKRANLNDSLYVEYINIEEL